MDRYAQHALAAKLLALAAQRLATCTKAVHQICRRQPDPSAASDLSDALLNQMQAAMQLVASCHDICLTIAQRMGYPDCRAELNQGKPRTARRRTPAPRRPRRRRPPE